MKQRFVSLLHHLQKKYRHTSLLQQSLIILLALSIIIGSVLWSQYQSLLKKPKKVESNVLVLYDMSPNGKVYQPQHISFRLSDAVDLHLFEHMFYIAPDIKGTFSQGGSDTEIIFTPDTPFPDRSLISVKIAKGLVSKNNKPLLNDYTNSFQTGVAGNEIQLVKDNVEARLMSFAQNDQVKFSVVYPKKYDHVTLSVYSAKIEDLINFLVFHQETKNPSGTYTYTEENYLNQTVPTGSNPIKTLSVNDSTQELTVPLPTGLYYIEAFDDNHETIHGTFVIVNTIGATLRQDDQKVTISAFDLASSQSVSEPLDVSFYSLQDAPVVLSRGTLSGTSTFDLPYANRLDLVLLSHGEERLVIPVKLPESQADIKVSSDLEIDSRIFVYTDRPIYQTDDIVKFRGIVRVDSDSLYKLPKVGTPIKVMLGYPYSGNKNLTVMSQTDEHGVFSGQFTLPKGTTGVQYLYASTNLNLGTTDERGTNYGMTYFDIAHYTKPEFELTAEVDKPEIIRHEGLTFTIKGHYFDGRPLTGQTVEYGLYAQNYYETEKAAYNSNFNIKAWGGMCGGGFNPFDEYYGTELPNKGTVTLDQNGQATVTYNPKDTDSYLSQKIALVARKQDKANNDIVASANSLVHASYTNIFFIPSSDRYQVGEEIVAPFYAETIAGEKLANTDFAYRLITTTYAYNQAGNKSNEAEYTHGSVTSDATGRAIVRIPFPSISSVGAIQLVVTKTDQYGNVAKNQKVLYAKTDETISKNYWSEYSTSTYLKIASSNNSYTVGETISLSVVSPKEIDVLFSLERGRIYSPRRIHLQKGENTISIPVTEDLSPSITPVFSFFADGQYHTEGLSLNVPALHRLLNVDITPDKETYQPNETAAIKVTTKEPNGTPISAQFSLGIVDKAIFALRKNATPPIHSSFYYFRPRRTNASSSLTWVGTLRWGGGGGGGGGDSLFSKPVDTLYWNPLLSTDANGEAIVPVQLNNQVTIWKAQVYAATDNSLVGQDDVEFSVRP